MDFNETELRAAADKAVAYHEKLYGCTIQVDLFILTECFVKTDESRRRDFSSSQAPGGYHLNQYKLAGILCFWIRKLKPFRVLDNMSENRFVNEAVGLFTGLSLVLGKGVKQNPHYHCPHIPPNYIHDIIKSFRYNSHSPNSSAFIFESLCL